MCLQSPKQLHPQVGATVWHTETVADCQGLALCNGLRDVGSIVGKMLRERGQLSSGQEAIKSLTELHSGVRGICIGAAPSSWACPAQSIQAEAGSQSVGGSPGRAAASAKPGRRAPCPWKMEHSCHAWFQNWHRMSVLREQSQSGGRCSEIQAPGQQSSSRQVQLAEERSLRHSCHHRLSAVDGNQMMVKSPIHGRFEHLSCSSQPTWDAKSMTQPAPT